MNDSRYEPGPRTQAQPDPDIGQALHRLRDIAPDFAQLTISAPLGDITSRAAGCTIIARPPEQTRVAPFGGYNASGLGRENAMDAIKEYTQLKTVPIELTGATRDPFVAR